MTEEKMGEMILKRNRFGMLLIAMLLWLTAIPAYAEADPAGDLYS